MNVPILLGDFNHGPAGPGDELLYHTEKGAQNIPVESVFHNV